MSRDTGQSDRREMTEREQTDSFIGRRMRAFADRSREPGDAVTWAVVLGSMVGVLLLICFSVARDTTWILVPLGLFVAWFAVVSILGRVNITSILWGAATSDFRVPPSPFWVFHPTAVLTGIATVLLVRDALTGWDYRWFGLALAAACVAYLLLYVRAGLRPIT